MNERLAIDIVHIGDKYFCQLSGRLEGAELFDVNGVSVDGDDMQTAGTKIYNELCKNRDVKKAIERALEASSQPIYINATAIPAQGVRWEALRGGDPARFVTLQSQSSIARIAGNDATRLPARFGQPLRICAVISAEERPGTPEWQALENAVRGAMAAGLRVDVRVVTGEDALHQVLVAAPPPWLTVAPVPSTVDELSIDIAAFRPHILHFFCHGQIDAGNAYLAIQGNAEELQLSIRELTQMSGLDGVWLVVLNSCLGGASLQGSPSMAYRIVADGNVPYAIGATENVEVRDAYTFTRAFYQRLLFNFGNSVRDAADNAVLTLEWRDALYAARGAINQNNNNQPATSHQWTLPVLYEHRTRLQVIMQPPQAAGAAAPPSGPDPAAVRARMAAELLAALPPDTSEATKRSLIAAILNQPNGR